MLSDRTLRTMVKGCYGKSRYSSEGKAQKYADKARAARGTSLRIYYCSECFGFHLTSKAVIAAPTRSEVRE